MCLTWCISSSFCRLSIHPFFLSRPSIQPFFYPCGLQFNLIFPAPLCLSFSPPISYHPCGLPHGVVNVSRPEMEGWISYPDCGYPQFEQPLCSYRRLHSSGGHINRARLYFLSAINSTFFLLPPYSGSQFTLFFIFYLCRRYLGGYEGGLAEPVEKEKSRCGRKKCNYLL